MEEAFSEFWLLFLFPVELATAQSLQRCLRGSVRDEGSACRGVALGVSPKGQGSTAGRGCAHTVALKCERLRILEKHRNRGTRGGGWSGRAVQWGQPCPLSFWRPSYGQRLSSVIFSQTDCQSQRGLNEHAVQRGN